jgi:hypothetical protein
MPEQQINDWVRHNQAALHDSLMRRRSQVLAVWPESAEEYDLSRLKLSEMKLCDAVSHMPLPPGFSAKYGEVKIAGVEPQEHDFASDGHRVFDLVTAQFFVKTRNTQHGSAEAEMLVKAPDLFVVCKDLAVLCGDIGKVAELLGLEFRWSQELE